MNSTNKIFQPVGILDGIQGKQLREEITSAINAGVNTVLIDMQDVTFMDSAGLGNLLATFRTIRAAKARLFLCSIGEQIKMLFDLTKMERVFDILDNREQFNEILSSKS